MRLLADGIVSVRMLSHEGKIVVIGSRADGSVVYTIRRDGFEDEKEVRQLEHWENWQPLPLPGTHGADPDPSVEAYEAAHNSANQSAEYDYIVRSRFDTHDQHVPGAISLVSGMGYVYVFRVSGPDAIRVSPDTPLVDRFVLDGMANRLIPALDLRYRRSRQKYVALEPQPGGPPTVDSLDFRDANGRAFYEPTTELSFLAGCRHISAALVPSGQPDRFRWHLAIQELSRSITLASMDADTEGGFDVTDKEGVPGIRVRRLHFDGQQAAGAPDICRFDRQAEQRDDGGDSRWVRVATELMLAVPVVAPDAAPARRRIATLVFPVRADGTLAEMDQSERRSHLLRGESDRLELPPHLLDEVEAVVAEPTSGVISGLRRRADGGVEIAQGDGGGPGSGVPRPAQALESAERVELGLSDMVSLDGSYEVRQLRVGRLARGLKPGRHAIYLSEDLPRDLAAGTRLEILGHGYVTTSRHLSAGRRMLNLETTGIAARADAEVVWADAFVIDPPPAVAEAGGLGSWEDLTTAEVGVVEGQILGMELGDGELIIEAFAHGLRDGDVVTIDGTRPMPGSYQATRRGSRFEIDHAWPYAEATNVQGDHSRRRGIVFPSADSWIEVANGGLCNLSQAFTMEAWIRTTTGGPIVAKYPASGAGNTRMLVLNGEGRLAFEVPGVHTVTGATPIADGAWHHVAVTQEVWADGRIELTLYADGQPEALRVSNFMVEDDAGAGELELNPGQADRQGPLRFGGAALAGSTRAPGPGPGIGEISEIRIWSRAHGRLEIRSQMQHWVYPKARDLVGYWRLGAIRAPSAGDLNGSDRVVDMSSGGNSGIVHGAAWITPSSFSRTLSDGETKASAFESPETFAAVMGGTYVEEFEFRFLDDRGQPIASVEDLVKCRYWGQTSRLAVERIPFDAAQDAEIEAVPREGGWWRLRSRYRVPEGVTQVRAFGVAVRGDWQLLQVRRHSLTATASTTSVSESSDTLRLTTAGEDLPRGLASKRTEMEGIYAAMVDRRNELGRLIKALQNIQEKIDLIDSVKRQRAQAQASADTEARRIALLRQNESNFYHLFLERDFLRYLGSLPADSRYFRIQKLREGIGGPDEDDLQTQGGRAFLWRKERIAGNTEYFRLFNDAYGSPRLLETNGREIRLVEDAGDPSRRFWWRTPYDPAIGYSYLRSFLPEVMTWGESAFVDNALVYTMNSARLGSISPSRVTISKTDIPTPQSGIHAAGRRRERYLRQAKDLDRQLAELAVLDASELPALIAERDATIDMIATMESILVAEEGAYLAAARAAPPAVDGSTIVGGGASDGGRPVTGMLLSFAELLGDVKLFESSRGEVLASYVDAQGCVRQTRYDAVASGEDTTSEQWIPDQVAMGLEQSGTARLPTPLAGAAWTFEAWMRFPLPEGSAARPWILGAEDEGIRVDGDGIAVATRSDEHYPFAIDLGEVGRGWHHLAVVRGGAGFEGTIRLFIDGRLLGDAVADRNDRAEVEGRTDTRGISVVPGRDWDLVSTGHGIAEIRTWHMALDAEEILTNSRVRLQGREPGLVSYHRLNASLADAADRQPLSVPNPKFTPCAAPVGNPGNRVVLLDGGTRIDISDTASGRKGMSAPCALEFWFRLDTRRREVQVLLNRAVSLPAGESQLYVRARPWQANLQWHIEVVLETPSQMRVVTALFKEFQSGGWRHLAVNVSGQGTVEAVLHNPLVGTVASSGVALTLGRRFGEGLDTGTSVLGGMGWRRTADEAAMSGAVAELRLWRRMRSPAEIAAGRHHRIFDHPELIARWGLDDPSDREVATQMVNDLPVGATDACLIEYPAYELGTESLTTAIMRRCTAVASSNGVDLWAQQRLDELELAWIGNAQFEPTLLGYIEGAPPVPSENLTIEPEGYSGATSVSVETSEEVALSWNRSKESSHGFSLDLFLGFQQEFDQGLVIPLMGQLGSLTLADIRVGFAGSVASSWAAQNESAVAETAAITRSDSLELRGYAEGKPHFEDLGPRFIPKNVGYALVVAGLADVFVSRLRTSGRMIGYSIRPVEDVPPDVTTITFLINPAYTMNGSLDGMTGSRATSERFHADVPGGRQRLGSLYPASYLRLTEAYELRRRIRDSDKRREAYFANFDVGLSTAFGDDAAIEARINDPDFAPKGVGVSGPGEVSGDGDQQSQLASSSAAADDIQDKLDDVAGELKGETKAQRELARSKKAEINRLMDPNQRLHAASAFATWQTKMEQLRVAAGKRNIVNSYVWDADGGLRVEAEEFASTVEHTVGSSVTTEWGMGVDFAVNIQGFQLELNPMYQGAVTQTLSKTRASSSALSLGVDLGGLEHQGITDHKDRPSHPSEKVDRYRFMSFYIDGKEDNFDDFFRYVVDPEWLASNDEEARALRMTQVGAKSRPWRVLHRVTQVERPALSGFGEDVRPLPELEEPSELERRLDEQDAQLALLAEENARLSSALSKKLDELQELISGGPADT